MTVVSRRLVSGWSILDILVCLTYVPGHSGSLDYEGSQGFKDVENLMLRWLKWRSTLLCKICRLYTQRQIRLPIGEG